MYRNKSNPPEIEEKLKEIRAEVMKDMPKARFPSLRGWRCPLCKRGLAPHVTVCPCVPITTNSKFHLGHPHIEYPASYNFDTEAFDRFLKVADEYKSRTTPSEA